jgi:hypothetical protein
MNEIIIAIGERIAVLETSRAANEKLAKEAEDKISHGYHRGKGDAQSTEAAYLRMIKGKLERLNK